MKKLVLFAISIFLLSGCEVLQKASQVALEEYNMPYVPSTTETVSGLKEALQYGTLNSIDILGKENGFYLDKLVKIGFPKEIAVVDQTLRKVGLSSVSDAFIQELNKGAEKAVTKAAPIFKNAIKQMTFADAMNILLGDENAATSFFEDQTRKELYDTFLPEVSGVLNQYGIASSYANMMGKYNSIPFVTKVNTNLNDYVTNKTLDGLFLKIALQEKEIRSDINVRSTGLMKRVFGYADKQKQKED